MATDLIVQPSSPGALVGWSGAAQRGLEARQERERIIKDLLKPDLDFGTIPGTDKPTLYKPGAEKINDSLNLYPDYEPITVIEQWDVPITETSFPVFFYRYRCVLKQRGTDVVIATGIGSCNSLEARYRWRSGKRKCPKCGVDAIIKGKEEYGGGWLCFKKKNGCDAKFDDDDASITSQAVGRIHNDDIHSQVNAIDKVSQKRALVAADLNLGFSEHFTQDLEDGGDHGEERPQKRAAPKKEAQAKPKMYERRDEATPNTYVIPFGKHKGSAITDKSVPTGYLQWIIERAKETLADESATDDKKKLAAKNLDIFGAEIARREVTPNPEAEAPQDEEDIPH